MQIKSTRPRAGRPQELVRDIDAAAPEAAVEIEVDEASDGNELAGHIEALPVEQQQRVAEQTARLVAQLPPDAQQAATAWFAPAERNAMLVGGIGGLGVGALVTGLRATNNPYLVVAGTIASGIATGYMVSRFPKKRMQVSGKSSGWLGEFEFTFDAATDTEPST